MEKPGASRSHPPLSTRTAQRIEFDPPLAASLFPTGSERAAAAQLLNLSEGGCALSIDGELRLPKPADLFGDLELAYPPGTAVSKMSVRLVHLRGRGGRWILGVAFVSGNAALRERVRGELRSGTA